MFLAVLIMPFLFRPFPLEFFFFTDLARLLSTYAEFVHLSPNPDERLQNLLSCKSCYFLHTHSPNRVSKAPPMVKYYVWIVVCT